MNLEVVKDYLKVDFTDDDTLIQTLIEVADLYIESCVGDTYKSDPKMVKLSEILKLKLVNDLYETRSTKVNTEKQDIIVTTILQKLAGVTI